jgi:hypothetical protein
MASQKNWPRMHTDAHGYMTFLSVCICVHPWLILFFPWNADTTPLPLVAARKRSFADTEPRPKGAVCVRRIEKSEDGPCRERLWRQKPRTPARVPAVQTEVRATSLASSFNQMARGFWKVSHPACSDTFIKIPNSVRVLKSELPP